INRSPFAVSVFGPYAPDTRRPIVLNADAGTDVYLDLTSQLRENMPTVTFTATAANALTFVEAGSFDTITRASGSFVTDGFKAGDYLTVTGTPFNAGVYKIRSVTALVITLEATDGAGNAQNLTPETSPEPSNPSAT